MPTIRSFSNAFEITDYTQELNVVPNSWTLLNDVGLFRNEYLSTFTVAFEEQSHGLGLIPDQIRGGKPVANKDELRKIHSYSIPHFPIADLVLPQDIQGKRAFGSNTATETTDAVIARKLLRIQKNMDITKEVARFSTLTTGNIYAPSGSVAGNFFTDFGVTQTVIDFALNTAGTDVVAKCEAVIAAMQDNATTGEVITGVICYASPEFFAALISHAKVAAAYQYYSATEGQSILRNRAGQPNDMNNGGLYRKFYLAGIWFVEVRTILAGVTLMPSKSAVFVPTGTDEVFVSYFGPANKMQYVNTIAEPGYVWTFVDPKGESIEIDAEFNMLNVIRRPQLVVKGTTP